MCSDLKLFETTWKREMAQVMRNAVERMAAGGSRRRAPARYKVKLPRFSRTVLEPPLNRMRGRRLELISKACVVERAELLRIIAAAGG
jgi:hypothetical protein